MGNFETRLASGLAELKAAQRVRFEVFCEELSAKTSLKNQQYRRDEDAHDQNCDHLLVLNRDYPQNEQIIGTQRFLIRTGESGPNQFYSRNEFDIAPLLSQHPKQVFMELGRSCILAEYRSKRTMELMWHGTWDYAVRNRVDFMFGCASFPTTDTESITQQLSFLVHQAPAEGKLSVTSSNPQAFEINDQAFDPSLMKKSIRALPPLIKGYLRLGAKFSKHAVRDLEFGTTDIMVILPVDAINPRYVAYYGSNADRHALQ